MPSINQAPVSADAAHNLGESTIWARRPAAYEYNGQTTKCYDVQWVTAILVATVTYQAILCMIDTQTHWVSRSLVGLAEVFILAACIPILTRRLLVGVLILAAFLGANLCLLSLFTDQVNVKAFRDLLIPLCYFWLGCNLGKPDLADRALTVAIAVVLGFGFLELLFLDAYTTVFDIFSYYVNIGNLQPITEYVRESRLQLNGIRPEGIGRTLLPSLLGSHRVSSVFLEPVSLGNFAAICAAWGLSRDKADTNKMAFFVAAAIVLMVLSDSRFALMSVSIMIGMRLLLVGKANNLAVFAPFAAVGLLLTLGYGTHERGDDNFHDRLALSGRSLLDFDLPMLLGNAPGEHFADQGYAYVISTFGLPLCLALWFSFWLLKMPNESSQRFRAFASVYIALILCVSGYSLFALKSAGILWFLVGTSLKAPALPDDSLALPPHLSPALSSGGNTTSVSPKNSPKRAPL